MLHYSITTIMTLWPYLFYDHPKSFFVLRLQCFFVVQFCQIHVSLTLIGCIFVNILYCVSWFSALFFSFLFFVFDAVLFSFMSSSNFNFS